ncbi:MAG TPA: class I SAM-dependent methyltransferase [Candidatus Limnocylindrales bacterium]|nr:class I SAM-dependent methyltransferase [Candidatus Limnocylindrales bacterium]
MVGSAEGANAFTGERPGWGEGFEYDYARHIAAYRVAQRLVGGRTVLDAGCGEGFGTQLLAADASSVTGVDYSEDAIRECRRLWTAGRPNLTFEQVDLAHPAAFSDRFDVVLCFQVIEHIHDPLPFLHALADRLAPGGTLVVTTPNRLRTVSENPYHVREYTAGELDAELRAVFSDVTIRGIHGNEKVEQFEEGRRRAVERILRLDPLGIRNLLPRRVVEFAFARLARLVRRHAKPEGAAPVLPEDFSEQDAVDRALDLLAFCRDPRPSR